MTETFVYESYYIAVYHIISLFLLVFMNAVIYFKTGKSRLLSSFYILQGILALWIMAKILKTFAPNASIKFFFVICQYAGVCFLGSVFIAFANIYTNGAKPGKKLMMLLLSISALCFLTVATNPLHNLFYTHFDFWGDSFGPLFYFQQAFNFMLFFIGGIICGKRFFGRSGGKRIQTIMLAIAIAIPMIANLLYVFRIFRKIFGFSPPFDITPMSAAASLIIFAFATFKFNFFDNLKIARRVALANVPEGILIVKGDRIEDLNETFKKMEMSGRLIPAEGNFDGELEKNVHLLDKRLPISFDTGKAHDFVYPTKACGYIRVICRPAKDKLSGGAFIRLIDVTVKQEILNELRQRNEKLKYANRQLTIQAEMKKRLVAVRTLNFIAQETHDILGHSIMLAISLLEIARLSADEFQVMECIRRAKRILSDGLNEINSVASVESKSPVESTKRKGITERLEILADEYRTAFVAVEIHCSDLKREPDSLIDDTIFKLCREGITNALRHGKATRVDIILRSRNEMMELFIIDNGLGCTEVKKGTGLSGMERRVQMLKGTFRCHPLVGQGFFVQASIPIY